MEKSIGQLLASCLTTERDSSRTPSDPVDQRTDDAVLVITCPRCSAQEPPFCESDTRPRRNVLKLCSECEGVKLELLANKRRELWSTLCPPNFRELNRRLLPIPQKLDEVLAWRFGPTGLLLHGVSRTGKTRCAWQLVRREFVAGRSVAVVTVAELRELMADQFDNQRAAVRTIQQWSNVDLLFLDDPFKKKLSASVQEAIFEVVDTRLAYERPCVVTVNDTEASLLARLSADYGPALLGRLKDGCRTITFERPEDFDLLNN